MFYAHCANVHMFYAHCANVHVFYAHCANVHMFFAHCANVHMFYAHCANVHMFQLLVPKAKQASIRYVYTNHHWHRCRGQLVVNRAGMIRE